MLVISLMQLNVQKTWMTFFSCRPEASDTLIEAQKQFIGNVVGAVQCSQTLENILFMQSNYSKASVKLREAQFKESLLLLNQNEQYPFLLLNSRIHSCVWLFEVKKIM
jgi:hypothetical protein